MRHRDVHFACESLLQQLVGAGYILLPGGGEPEDHIVDKEGPMPILASTDCGLISTAPSISNLSTTRRHCRRRLSRLGWVRSIARRRQAPGASVQYPYQSALHNAPLLAPPAASTTEIAGLANIATPGTKLNTVCSPSKPTRAAGHELQNRCRTSSGPFAFGWLLAICCWSSLITSAGITVVDCAIAVLRLYGIASASCHPPLSGRMPT